MTVRAVFEFTWLASGFDPCPKCRALNGRSYIIDDIFQPELEDAEYGPVWNLDTDTSMAHPNCHCFVAIELVELDVVGLDALIDAERLLP